MPSFAKALDFGYGDHYLNNYSKPQTNESIRWLIDLPCLPFPNSIIPNIIITENYYIIIPKVKIHPNLGWKTL